METPTLARKLGTTTHVSGLLIKARRLGLTTPRELCTLAVQRGCRHYAQGDEPPGELVSREEGRAARRPSCPAPEAHSLGAGGGRNAVAVQPANTLRRSHHVTPECPPPAGIALGGGPHAPPCELRSIHRARNWDARGRTMGGGIRLAGPVSGDIVAAMETPTLARKLGTTTHVSGLLIKARRLGLTTPRELCTLAVQRGCRHYAQGDEPPGELVPREQFSDEELAVALLNVALPYDPRAIRCGAAMLSAPGNDPARLAWMAKLERSEIVLRHVAEAGRKFEPDHPFWPALLALLPATPTMPDGVLLHPTRFIAMTGIRGRGERGLFTEWQRPGGAPTVSHAQR